MQAICARVVNALHLVRIQVAGGPVHLVKLHGRAFLWAALSVGFCCCMSCSIDCCFIIYDSNGDHDINNNMKQETVLIGLP